MSIQHLLEDFATSTATAAGARSEKEDTELLESFEQGYKAGWEDAIRAKSEEHTHISADLARSLHDLSFTYHEAHAAILADVAPVVEQAIMAVLPEVARNGFGANVAAEIARIAKEGVTTDVILRVSAEDLNAVEDALADPSPLPTRIEIDETLNPGQAHMAFGSHERRVDISEIVNSIGQAFEGFVQQAAKEASNE